MTSIAEEAAIAQATAAGEPPKATKKANEAFPLRRARHGQVEEVPREGQPARTCAPGGKGGFSTLHEPTPAAASQNRDPQCPVSIQ